MKKQLPLTEREFEEGLAAAIAEGARMYGRANIKTRHESEIDELIVDIDLDDGNGVQRFAIKIHQLVPR